MNMVELDLNMKDLFEIFDASDINYEEVHDIVSYNLKISTPSGWQNILGMVRKHAVASVYYFDDDSSLTCANHHLVFENGVCKPIMNCSQVDTNIGTKQIIGSQLIGNMDLFDIALPPPHQYVCNKGIIHHNTSLAFMLLKLLKVNSGDIKFVNGCTDNGIDVVRDLENFVSTMPMGDYRYVLIDECLDELTPVWVKNKQTDQVYNTPIREVQSQVELVMNFNTDTNTVEWSEFTLYDKGVQDVYEITLDNGETVVCTASHKWYVRDQHDNVLVVTTDQLDEYNHILSPVV